MIALLLSGMLGAPAHAYPEFISYGYKACLTCHYNGQGSGALNDYGRGVWASEIAARHLYPSSWSLEDMSAKSGFLGSVELPYWLRPSIKARSLQLEMNPGSSKKVSTYYPMQLDFSLAVPLDQEQRYLVSVTYGYKPDPANPTRRNFNRILLREAYARINIGEPYWVYLGKLDKVFGIRTVDHTAYSRVATGLTQNTQSVGGILHYIQETYEITGQYFVGDPNSLTPTTEQKGFTFMTEYDFDVAVRAGFSLLSSKSDAKLGINAYALHVKQGIGKSAALLVEQGIVQTKDETAPLTLNASYTLAETSVRLTRGVHLLTNVERYVKDVSTAFPEQWKFGLGFQYFPTMRYEVRLGGVHTRATSTGTVTPDQWALQGQLHVAL